MRRTFTILKSKMTARLANLIDNGGVNGDYEYDIEECTYVADDPADSDWDTIDGGYETLEEAKRAVDNRIVHDTTFQSEAGN